MSEQKTVDDVTLSVFHLEAAIKGAKTIDVTLQVSVGQGDFNDNPVMVIIVGAGGGLTIERTAVGQLAERLRDLIINASLENVLTAVTVEPVAVGTELASDFAFTDDDEEAWL